MERVSGEERSKHYEENEKLGPITWTEGWTKCPNLQDFDHTKSQRPVKRGKSRLKEYGIGAQGREQQEHIGFPTL